MMQERKKRLLLHICCAPCAVYVMKKLQERYDVTGFFYNPNIQPRGEYDFRLRELEKIARRLDWEVLYGEYDMRPWFRMVKGLEREPERGRRCSLCFTMRLGRTFDVARERDFELVASTLSISPYKVTRQINAEGLRLSEAYGIEFLPENFKKLNGFNISKQMAMEMEIRHQDYCGCVYSKADRIVKNRAKMNDCLDQRI